MSMIDNDEQAIVEDWLLYSRCISTSVSPVSPLQTVADAASSIRGFPPPLQKASPPESHALINDESDIRAFPPLSLPHLSPCGAIMEDKTMPSPVEALMERTRSEQGPDPVAPVSLPTSITSSTSTLPAVGVTAWYPQHLESAAPIIRGPSITNSATISTDTLPAVGVSAWYPQQWIHRRPRPSPILITAASLPIGQAIQLSPSPSRSEILPPPLPSALKQKTHCRSQSDPLNNRSRPILKRRARPGSSNSSSSSSSTSSIATHRPAQKSCLHRTSSTMTTRTAKSAKSVKFVDIPEVHYDYLYEDDYSGSPCADNDDDPNLKSGWTQGLKRFVVDHQGAKKKAKLDIPGEQKLPISGPYRLYSGSCPTLSLPLSLTDPEKDADADMRPAHSKLESESGSKPYCPSFRSEGGRVRSILERLWRGLFAR